MEVSCIEGGTAMTVEETSFRIWVDWDRQVASLQPVAGFEMICFFSREKFQENLRILSQSGFQIQ